jgi:hypothetical protein
MSLRIGKRIKPLLKYVAQDTWLLISRDFRFQKTPRDGLVQKLITVQNDTAMTTL